MNRQVDARAGEKLFKGRIDLAADISGLNWVLLFDYQVQ